MSDDDDDYDDDDYDHDEFDDDIDIYDDGGCSCKWLMLFWWC